MSSYENLMPMIMSAASGTVADADRNHGAESQRQALERDNQLIAAQQAERERQRRNLLDQQQATARAQMAAWGVGGDGGSAAAILAGMAQDASQAVSSDGRMAQARMERNRGRADNASPNLLDGMSDGFSIFQSFYGGGE